MDTANIISELLPRKVRLVIYVLLFLAALVFAAWQAAEGNWLVFVGSLLTSLTGLLAAGNSTAPAIAQSANKIDGVIVVQETTSH